jgi:hypothetical protein
MSIDHFEKHQRKSPIDWNFNLLFDNQTEVIELSKHYKPALEHSGLYDPIPVDWLHATILRVGLLEDYTEQEMLAVADSLQLKLNGLSLPEFHFDSWWLWGGNVVFHLSPDKEFGQLYNAVIKSLQEVVGKARTTKTPHGHFIPHTALAYTRTHDYKTEKEIYNKLIAVPSKSASFKATNISLIKQHSINGHYEWEVIRRVNIGK